MPPLSAVLVGDAAITVRCGQLLRLGGHPLLGVVTGDGRVAAWAAEAGLPCCFLPAQATLTREDVGTLVAGAPFDLLLSVHNLRILPPDLLALPRALAINYHDGPLPRYAGLHATSWAIAHGETSHGIAWHVMTPAVDAGEVLVERRLAVELTETAWTLNIRCTEAAIDGFAELLEGLERGSLRPCVQDAAARTYFPGWRRPTSGCVVPWHESAARISAFVRGLEFGAADNPLGIPKLLAPGGVFLVPKVTLLTSQSGAPAGTVLREGIEGLDVATTTFDVRLPLLTAIDGLALPPANALSRLGLALGDRLAASAPSAEQLAALERVLYRQEPHWNRVLADLAPLVPPGLAAVDEPTSTIDCAIELDLPEGTPGRDDVPRLAAAILAWLGEEIGQPFDVAFGEPELRAEIAAHGWQGLVVSRPPLRVHWHAGSELEEFAQNFFAERARRRDLWTYASDLPHRIRRRQASPAGPLAPLAPLAPMGPAIAVDLLAPLEVPPVFPADSAIRLAIAVHASGGKVTLSARIPAASDILDGLGHRLVDWLRSPPASRSVAVTATGAGAATVGDRFREHVLRTPQALALVSGAESFTYERLALRVDRLAAALARRGVSAETLVALRLPRLADLVTAMLAVHQAGGAFLVLEPLDSSERVGRILAESQPLLAVCASGDGVLHRIAPYLAVHPIGLGDASEISPSPARAVASVPARSSVDLAYVATTSGSTGAPKGVAVEQGALAHYLAAAGRKFELDATDRILQLGSPAFDLALEQIFGALCCGATLVGLDPPSLPAPRELLAACDALAVTVLDLPTAVWEQAASEVAARALSIPASLRLLIVGGEAASARAARVWLDASGGARLVNTYGPTEATIVATWWDAPRRAADLAGMTGLPIGRPLEGVCAHVLDLERRPVVDGEEGELWLGGRGLARGYHRRPELTAARFVRLEFGLGLAGDTAPGARSERLYATGDRVRRRADGELEFLGRFDRQVKIAGRRVEPGEVEATLLSIPGVRAAAVAPIPQLAPSVRAPPARPAAPAPCAGIATRLQAWVVLDMGTTLATVAAEAGSRLPTYLRPGVLSAVAALPLTVTGKVDIERLRSGSAAAPAVRGAAGRVAPTGESLRDETEIQLAAIWERLLGSDASIPIARDSDFFALGGDSLAAVSLLVEIEAAFGIPLKVASLLRSPTVGGLAAELRAAGATSEQALPVDSSLVTILPAASASTPRIFCVHGLGGHLLRLIPLARALAPECALVGLQSPGLDDERPIPQTIEELARIFLTEIRAAPTPPPYRLAGMSFGGIVAFEMSCIAAPGEIASIAMFDTELAEVLPEHRPPALSGTALLKERLRRFAGDELGRLRRAIRHLALGHDEVLKANEYRHFTRVLRANEAAMARYLPGTGAGKVKFFAATTRPASLYEEFERRTGCELVLVPVPGDHLSMLEPPQVETLAAALKELG